MIVALNKIDQPEVLERWPKLKKELKKRGYEAMAISALARTNVRELLLKAVKLLAELPCSGGDRTAACRSTARPKTRMPLPFPVNRTWLAGQICRDRTGRRDDPLGPERFGAAFPEADGAPGRG